MWFCRRLYLATLLGAGLVSVSAQRLDPPVSKDGRPNRSNRSPPAGQAPTPDSAQRELPLWLVERAYRRAPNDMNWVHLYIRAQVLARTNLLSPLTPRALPNALPDEFKFITDAPKFSDSSPRVPADKLLADLDFLEVVLANV